ncbi:hypothetical protein D3C72_1138920 [compost metagenome]
MRAGEVLLQLQSERGLATRLGAKNDELPLGSVEQLGRSTSLHQSLAQLPCALPAQRHVQTLPLLVDLVVAC